MISEIIEKLLIRDLQKLRQEISLYKNESVIWATDKAISNSAGNLCLHLVGNLNTYIGAILGSTGYTRNREQEFSLKNIPRNELLQKIDDTVDIIEKTFAHISDEQLTEDYPVLVWEQKTNTAYLLFHLVTHLGYHLGQVNYHRRLLDNSLNRFGESGEA